MTVRVSLTNTLAIQVADRGQIFSSADLTLWVPEDSGTSNDLQAVTFLSHSSNRILVSGESGTMLYADWPGPYRPGTLLDGPTSDWLVAIAVSENPQPRLAVAVGDNGAVYTSTNGIHWKRQSSGTSLWLLGVAWGTNGFVACGENGKIITSANGTNWTARTSGVLTDLDRVSFQDGRYTIVGAGGICLTNGSTLNSWLPVNTGASNALYHTASSIARIVVGDSEVRLKEPGTAWTDELAKTNGPTPWTYYANIALPNYFLIAGRTGLMEEGVKTNGAPYAWEPSDESIRNWLWDVANPTNLYVAVGDFATVMTSGNGGNWKLELVPDAVTNSIFLGVGGTADMLVTVGEKASLIISPNIATTNTIVTNGVPTNIVSNSYGVLWYAITNLATTNDLQGVGATTNLFVVTGGNGTILTSPDATNWTQRTSPTSRFLSSVTPWTRGWVATGDDGALVASSDGIAWSLLPPPTTNWISRVRFLGERLIAVGQNGIILTSTNAVNWSKTNLQAKWLNDVAFVDNTYFVVGLTGAVYTSSNAVDWVGHRGLTKQHLYGAASDSRQLVSVGVEGIILRSQIVPDNSPITILSYDRGPTTNQFGIFLANLYLFGGKPDQKFTLDRRVAFDTNSWATGPQLEFFDGSGTLFYLETITISNPPPKEYYRATLIPQ